ncbi:uncharacterized protein LOC109607209 isoform X2 [Aethina tumida]|uniref:uncharacterized protein LOC109607209 isoform X2 n=1 Tax=Aethina tumida TaxID=116153 RepID=UPI002148AD2C|nr:uncharacterized protein LOC109607209 isoform X2 [Aethina tumida]
MGLGRFFFEKADEFADRICTIDANFDVKETYASLKTRAIRTALALRRRGIKQGDIVMICSNNNLNNIVPFIAALYLGAKVASIDPSLSPLDCQHCIKIVPPSVAFVQDESVYMVEKSLKETENGAEIIVLGQSFEYATLESFLQPTEEETTFRPVDVDVKDTAIIYFSSGTTGMPKGICCTHEGLYLKQKTVLDLDFVNADVVFHFTSLYWISAAICLIMTFIKGGCRVLTTDGTPERALQIFERYGVTFSFMAPIFALKLDSVPNDKYDLSSLYSLCLGGTPLILEHMQRIRKFFKDTKVQLCYGMTEIQGYATCFDFKDGDLYLMKDGSSGKTTPDTDIKIVDIETRKLLPPNKRGEICIKTPYLCAGYYNQDITDNIDEEGYYKTGDVGYYDDDECIYVVDRIKEMFKYQSWHIVPTFLEQILMEHPDIQESVVFGIPHDIDGDHPAACVVLKEGSSATVDELHEFYNARVADRQKLRGGIKLVKSIPKTPSNKFLRRKAREMFLNMQ